MKDTNQQREYHHVWDVMTHNINQLIEKEGLYPTHDKTTWPNSSYAGMQGQLQGMLCDKGGHHVLLLDSKWNYIYARAPHHKFFEVKALFTAIRPVEVKCFVDIIKLLIKGAYKDLTDSRKQIFSEPDHTAIDNFLSCNEVLRYLGGGGWKETMTCIRDCQPKSVPRKYFNFIKATPVNAKHKVATFEQPIITVKNVWQPKRNANVNEPSTRSEEGIFSNTCIILVNRWNKHILGQWVVICGVA